MVKRERKIREQKSEKLTEEDKLKHAVDNAESVDEAKIYKKRQFMHKFKLGSHYRMERFTVMFGALTVFLLFFSLIGWSNNHRNLKQDLSTKAIYSTSFEFSLSKSAGTVINVYRDTDGKRAVVLLKLEDVSNLSVDATNYELFLSSVENNIKTDITGSLFMFGSSGYVGVELNAEEGLPNDVLNFTLRSNSKLAEEAEPLTEDEIAELEDASFATNDQAVFYVNVGAKDVVPNKILDGEMDPIETYYSFVGRDAEDILFEDIKTKTTNLKRLLERNNEYSNRLVELGFEAPKAPTYMDGDYVNEDGVFTPRTNITGYHAIEYADQRIPDGFVNQVVDDVSGLRDYMSNKRAEAEQALGTSVVGEGETPPVIEKLKRNDGYELNLVDVVEGDSTTNEASARTAVETLGAVWSEYLEEKRSLQIQSMQELLLLDADVRTQGEAFSEYSGKEFLTVW